MWTLGDCCVYWNLIAAAGVETHAGAFHSSTILFQEYFFYDRNHESFGSSSSGQRAFFTRLAFFVDFVDRSALQLCTSSEWSFHSRRNVFLLPNSHSAVHTQHNTTWILRCVALPRLPHSRQHHVTSRWYALPHDGCTETKRPKGNMANRSRHRKGSSCIILPIGYHTIPYNEYYKSTHLFFCFACKIAWPSIMRITIIIG